MGLISSLLNVASSQDVPFHQPLQLQCSHHGSTKAYLCSPLFLILSPLPHRWQFAVAPLHGSVEDLVIALIAEVLNSLLFCLKHSVKCQTTLKTKHSCPFAFSLWLINPRVHAITSEFSIFPYSCKERYFSCSPLSVQQGEHTQIQNLLAYEIFVN